MRAYSNELRQRILRAVDQGHRQAEGAAAFQVPVATIGCYLKQHRETGRLSVKPIPGRTPKKRAALEAGLSTQLTAHDDATVEQHCQLWAVAHGQQVSPATTRRAIARLGWTRKKSLGATKRSETARAAWRDLTGYLPVNDLLFVDECGSTIRVQPQYGKK
ncbi:MAG TPA: hypothetical protein VH540_00280 [Ktedonobacterales bacterium]|jgi:transposase